MAEYNVSIEDKTGFLVNDKFKEFPYVVVQIGNKLFKLKEIKKEKIGVDNISILCKKYDIRFLTESLREL